MISIVDVYLPHSSNFFVHYDCFTIYLPISVSFGGEGVEERF